MDLLFVILFLASVASALFSIWLDWDVSKRFPWYGAKESTDLVADERGYVSNTKVAVMTALKLAPFLLVFFTSIGWWVLIWGPVVGIPHLIKGLQNRKNARNRRISQIKFRNRLFDYILANDRDGFRMNSLRVILQHRDDKTQYYRTQFSWLGVTATSLEDAKDKLVDKFFEWGQLQEVQAWPDTKFHPSPEEVEKIYNG